MLDSRGQDLRTVRWMDGYALARRGVLLYHYSLVFPRQVTEKCAYYNTARWARRKLSREWARRVFLGLESPFRVHNMYEFPSWLERFTGDHPPQVGALKEDLRAHRLDIETRRTDDIERLLCSLQYRLGRAVLKLLERLERRVRPPFKRYGRKLADEISDRYRIPLNSTLDRKAEGRK